MLMLDVIELFLQFLQHFGLCSSLSLDGLRAVKELLDVKVHFLFELIHTNLGLSSVLLLVLLLLNFFVLLFLELISMGLLPYFVVHFLGFIKSLVEFFVGGLVLSMLLVFG